MPEFLMGFLFATAIGVVILLFVADSQTYHQICEPNQYTGKESCASHNILYVIAWYVGRWLNASATAVTAIATIVIAAFTGTLWWSTRSALNVTNATLELSRSEFLATNRPLLRVRYFKRTDAENDPNYDVRFTVVNVGKSAAHLLGSALHIAYFPETKALPAPIYVGGLDVTGQRKFEVGASDEYVFSPPKPSNRGPYLPPFHVYGYIVYADGADNTRTTAFCRRWSSTHGRFTGVNDSDYEYED